MNPIRLAGIGIGGVVLLLLFLMTYFTVGQNERGVVTSWGQFSYVAEPGLHFKFPMKNGVAYLPIDLQILSSGDEWINTYTIDSQEVDVSYKVIYRIDPAKVQFIYTNNQGYKAQLLTLALDRMKSAMGLVNTQMVAEKRGEIRDAIRKTLITDAEPYGITVVDFQLTNLKYTDAFRNAINAAAVQKANIESFEYQRQQSEKQALTDKISAEGKANAAIAQAKGEADARVLNAKASAESAILAATAEAKGIQLKGEATAAAINAQAEALKANATLVEMEKAKRWDGKLPTSIYAGAPIPFMSMAK